jgi:hypothetical protein
MASDEAESREKALCLFSRFELPHFLLSQSCGLVRVFRSIVEPFVLPMLHAKQDFTFRRSIALQCIGNDHARDVLKPIEKLAEKSLRGLLVASDLHENIEHVAVLIHCSPQIMPLTTDREKDLVQVPFVPTLRAVPVEFVSVLLPKL